VAAFGQYLYIPDQLQKPPSVQQKRRTFFAGTPQNLLTNNSVFLIPAFRCFAGFEINIHVIMEIGIFIFVGINPAYMFTALKPVIAQ
jgi:hypothetical protein